MVSLFERDGTCNQLFLQWKISIVHRLQHLFLLSTFYKWKAPFIFAERLYGSIEPLFIACVDEEVQGDKAADHVTLLSHLICL